MAEATKWEAKATVKLNGPKPEQVWTVLIEDFCHVSKWLPAIDTSHKVEGVDGEVGLVRHVSSTVPGGGESTVNWCLEKLVNVDHGQRSLSYQVVENNIGIKHYVSTLKVLDGGDEFGCVIEWSYVADPFGGFTSEGFFGYITYSLQAMAEKLEKELQSSS